MADMAVKCRTTMPSTMQAIAVHRPCVSVAPSALWKARAPNSNEPTTLATT
ncbi:hypothetical protein D3C80_932710 [compost metagenome]